MAHVTSDMWVAIIGLIGVTITTVRWWLAVLHKNKMREIREREAQAKRVEDLRETNSKLFSSDLTSKIKLMENIIEGLKLQMGSLRVSIEKLSQGQGKFDAFADSMKKFILNKEDRVARLESEVKRISDNLILIKGTKNGTQD